MYESYLPFLVVSLGRHARAAHIRDIGTWGGHSEKPFEAFWGRLEAFWNDLVFGACVLVLSG